MMNQTAKLNIALYLPYPDIEALIHQKTIVAISQRFINPGRTFVLYPVDLDPNQLQTHYQSDFIQQLSPYSQENTIKIQAWGKSEKCEIEENSEILESLAQITVWTSSFLQNVLKESNRLFLAYLRVHQLVNPVEIPKVNNAQNQLGKITGLSKPVKINPSQAVLEDAQFVEFRQQLENRSLVPQPVVSSPSETPKPEPEPPPLPREENSKTKEPSPSPPVQKKEVSKTKEPTPSPSSFDLHSPDWYQQIAVIGNSSQGHDFEKLVRKSFIVLGFSNNINNSKASLEPESTGGAGGLDFYATDPYPIVGECKATQTEKVPDGTPAQLIKLGHKILQDQYNSCVKILAVAGELTSDAQQTAIGNQMNVIHPETLERLVKLKIAHAGAVNLLDLKAILEQESFGEEADQQINQYIDQMWGELELRSHLVQTVKQYLENSKDQDVSIDRLCGVYSISTPPKPLSDSKIHEILIELSSPLTGYLGRIKGEGKTWKSDRIYFLREFLLNP